MNLKQIITTTLIKTINKLIIALVYYLILISKFSNIHLFDHSLTIFQYILILGQNCLLFIQSYLRS